MNCKECIHFEACSKWTDFPKQCGEPTCRHFEQRADVVEVVRCKDCKYCESYYAEKRIDQVLTEKDLTYVCNRHGYGIRSSLVLPTNFCNCGERREK